MFALTSCASDGAQFRRISGRKTGFAGCRLLHHAVQAPRPAAHGARPEQLQALGRPQPVRDPPEPVHQHHAGGWAAHLCAGARAVLESWDPGCVLELGPPPGPMAAEGPGSFLLGGEDHSWGVMGMVVITGVVLTGLPEGETLS